MSERSLRFPQDFMFGAGLGDYQHFGGSRCDLPRIEASRHYWLYNSDLELIANLGLNSFRTSVEWARIEESEGEISERAISWYLRYMKSVKARKLTTLVTLHHFTNPAWVHRHGAWLSDYVVDRFLEYVRLVASRLGELIDYFLVFNEPINYSVLSHYFGERGLPPNHVDREELLKVRSNMAEATKKAYDIIHEATPSAMVGVSYSFNPVESRRWWSLSDRAFADLISENANMEHLEMLAGRIDFIGVNYYAKFLVDQGGRKYIPIVFHRGLGETLSRLHERFGKPLIVTANGFPNKDDRQRTAFMLESLRTIHESIHENGTNVLGYFWWPFVHGWEWGGLGYAPFFALVDVDIGKTYARYVTTTAQVYKEVAMKRAIDQNTYLAYVQLLPKIEFENWPAVPTA